MSTARDSPKPMRTARSPLPPPTSPLPVKPQRMGRASSSNDAAGVKRKRPPRDELDDEVGFIESATRAVYESDSRADKKELHRSDSTSSLPLPSKPKRLKEDAPIKSEPKDPPSRIVSAPVRPTHTQASSSSSRPAPNGVSVKTIPRTEPPKTNGTGSTGSRRKRVAEHNYTSSEDESAPTPQPSRPAVLPRPSSPKPKASAGPPAPSERRSRPHPTTVEGNSPPKPKPRPPKFSGPSLSVLLGPLPTEHSALRERWSDCYVHYSSLWARLTAEMHQSEKLLRNNGDVVEDEDVEMLDADEVESMKLAYNALHQKLKDIRRALGFRD